MLNTGRATEAPRVDTCAPGNGHAPLAAEPAVPIDPKLVGGRYAELQSAVRFPLRLRARITAAGAEHILETENISANGVLFKTELEMPVGSPVDFEISLPSDVVGADADVRLDGRGRVVRNCNENGTRGLGVVIDEYRIERH